MTVKPLRFQAPIPGTYGNFNPDVKLIAEAISVDPMARTIAMNWYPDFTSVNCDSTIDVDIYLSFTLLDVSSPSYSATSLADAPVYRLNNTRTCHGLTPIFTSFRTVTKLVAAKKYGAVEAILHQSSFQSYPFDVYLAPFYFYSKNVETGTVSALQISDSFGVAVNFEISLDEDQLNRGSGIEDNLQFSLRIKRSTATKAFVTIVGITNWLTATAFLTICAAAVVYHPHEIYSEMFVVPVGALFAFSSVRANFPGAPVGFGATIGQRGRFNLVVIDFTDKLNSPPDTFTILPVLIIMAMCSFVLLLIILYRRISQSRTIHKAEGMQNPTGILSAEREGIELSKRRSFDLPRSISNSRLSSSEVTMGDHDS